MATAASNPATERFWSTLIGFIREGQVIPVVGQELVTIEHEGRTMRIMDAVASKLAAELVAEGKLDDRKRCIEDQSCNISTVIGQLPERDRPEFLARAHELLRDMCRGLPTPLPLQQLAEIEPFRLFATTTVDGLLGDHLHRTVSGGLLPWQRPAWNPRVEAGKADLDRPGPFDSPVVFQLLGTSSATPDTAAVTDEEILVC